jgi:hypothetical protein
MGTVVGDEGTIAARAETVNHAGQQFFAGSTLRLNQNVGVAPGHLPGPRNRPQPHGRMSHQGSAVRVWGGRAFEDALGGFLQLFESHGLDQVVAGAAFHGRYRIGHAAKCGQENHGGVRRQGAHFAHDRKPIAVRHADVGHDQRRLAATELGKGFRPAGGRFHPPPAPLKAGLERGAHPQFIVHYQHLLPLRALVWRLVH